MKKLFGVLTIVALMTTAAFAQEEAEGLSFSASGRAVWITVANSIKDNGDPIGVGGLQLQDGSVGPRNALTIKGTSEHVGFWLDIFADGKEIGIGDNALIWAKPFSWARLVFAGKHDENIGSSGAAWGLWDWDRLGVYKATDVDNFIFPDLLDKTISLEITPIEGLLIAGAINLPLGIDGTFDPDGNGKRYGDAMPTGTTDSDGNLISVSGGVHGINSAWYLGNIFGRTGSLLISYTAAEIVTVKFGLSGAGYHYRDNAGEELDKNSIYSSIPWMGDAIEWDTPIIIDAAVEATPIEGLRLALGAHAPTVVNNFVGRGATMERDYFLDQNGGKYGYCDMDPRITFAVGVGMVENLNIGFRFGLSFLAMDWNPDPAKTWEDRKDKVGFTLGLGVDYTFDGPGVNIFLDVGYADGIWMANNSAEGYDSFTIGAGVSKNFSNGTIGIGFAGTTNGDKYGRHALNEKSFAWEIPVMVTYSF